MLNLYVIYSKEFKYDHKQLKEKNLLTNKTYQIITKSNEIHILKMYRWALLKSNEYIQYTCIPFYEKNYVAMLLPTTSLICF